MYNSCPLEISVTSVGKWLRIFLVISASSSMLANARIFNSTEHTITNTADYVYSMFAIDVDGDGDIGVLSASVNDDTVAWYENDANQGFTKHTITNTADGAISVFAIDVDRDGDVDVLSASHEDVTVAWYENDGNQGFTKHTITNTADGARSVFAIDVDGDGDIDILSASCYHVVYIPLYFIFILRTIFFATKDNWP